MHTPPRIPAAFPVPILILIAVSGCSTTARYRAAELPAELAARPAFDVRTIDLNRLGTAASDDGRIHERDVLSVAITAGDEAEAPPAIELPVALDGTVVVPLVGSVHVTGQTLSQAADAIRTAGIQRQVYTKPAVSVLFSKRYTHSVTVAGAVQNPGRYQLRAGSSTLATALLAAGGITSKAIPNVEIHTPAAAAQESLPPTTDPEDFLQTSHQQPDEQVVTASQQQTGKLTTVSLLHPHADHLSSTGPLPDGTVITVPEQPARFVSVIGLTNNKTIPLPYDRDFRILDALAQAGGPNYSPWIANKLKVLRSDPDTGDTVVINVTIGKAKLDSASNIALAPGDVLSVEETPLTFTLGTIGQLVGIGRNISPAGIVP